ncbi:hypothetical protein IVB45_01470 [Bradyrhizobium sp. 4]|nr:hypothetical protein [Bradyrhizobium sp. 39]MCK1746790.1 hypothetical protein [Bradyrhizobium sp. 135]UPJ38595.1 hypothetical protein IVB45_01470 [Bradyrhizobium sp. 4]
MTRHRAKERQTSPSAGRNGISILDAVRDARLFWPWFSKKPESWGAWLTFLAALFAVQMTPDQLKLFQRCTGRKKPPTSVARYAYLICGRRAGKSFVLALVATFLACFFDYRPYLAPGERCTVMIVASDRRQARTILRYIRALLKEVPLLACMIERETAEGFDLDNRVTIEISTASMKSVRGYTVVAALLDEAAFFTTDEGSASPDAEIVKAIKPAMSTIPNAMLLVASSPYAKRGVLYEAYRDHFGKEGDPTLVWQADTRTMNPSVPQSEIDEAYAADPASASAEFGAVFRNDIESYISLDTVLACVSDGIFERPAERGFTYSAFLDPAGGSGQDSYTLAIGHLDAATGMAIVDCIREAKPPFSPEETTATFAATLKSYGIRKVIGDRFAGEWVREPLRKHGISYDPSAKAKSDLYRDVLPLINSRKIDFLHHKRMVQQFVGLEMRTSRAGKPSIDHAPNQHDDVSNAVAGLIANIGGKRYRYRSDLDWVGGDDLDDNATFRVGRLQRYLFSGGLLR